MAYHVLPAISTAFRINLARSQVSIAALMIANCCGVTPYRSLCRYRCFCRASRPHLQCRSRLNRGAAGNLKSLGTYKPICKASQLRYRQQWLGERASTISYAYIACLVCWQKGWLQASSKISYFPICVHLYCLRKGRAIAACLERE